MIRMGRWLLPATARTTRSSWPVVSCSPAPYGGSVALAYWAGTKESDASELYIPVVGPIVGIVNIESNIQHCYDHGGSLCGVERLGSFFAYPFLAADAIAQGGGVGFFLAGMLGTSSARQAKKARAPAAAHRPRVTPYTTGTTFGLTGSF